MNLNRLIKKMGYKYSERGSSPKTDTSSSNFDQFGDGFDDKDDSVDILGKGKRPMTRPSSKKT